MLGVIHRDPATASLLHQWLESLSPDTITLEFSAYGLEFREKNGTGLRDRLAKSVDELRAEGLAINNDILDSVLAYISLPAEFTVARDFCNAHRVPLSLVDIDGFSSLKLQRVEELLTKDNLSKLLNSPSVLSGGHKEKAIARLFFEKGVKAFEYTEEMRLRDQHASSRLDCLMDSLTNAHILYICGWQHLSDPCGFYEPLHPTKVFMYDKTVCI